MSQPEQASSAPANDAAAVRRSSSRWDRAAWELAALAALVLAMYVPALSADFIWDDDENVVTNQTLRSLDGLRQMWFVPGATQQYYPLMYTSYWLEYHLWGLDPLGYHLVNMLLHAAAAVLFWRLLLRLEVPGAWLAAALFAVHPVMVESVAWITERKNVLSLVLALLAMLAYLRFAPPEEARPRGSWRFYVVALALFALALAAKTVVVTLPFVLLVIYWWKRGTIHARDVLRLAPFFALSVAMGFVTMLMETHYVGRGAKSGRSRPWPGCCWPAGRCGFTPASLHGLTLSCFSIRAGRSTCACGGNICFRPLRCSCLLACGFCAGGLAAALWRRCSCLPACSCRPWAFSTSTTCATPTSRTIFNTTPAWP